MKMNECCTFVFTSSSTFATPPANRETSLGKNKRGASIASFFLCQHQQIDIIMNEKGPSFVCMCVCGCASIVAGSISFSTAADTPSKVVVQCTFLVSCWWFCFPSFLLFFLSFLFSLSVPAVSRKEQMNERKNGVTESVRQLCIEAETPSSLLPSPNQCAKIEAEGF